ncbi:MULTISPECIES: hypothetical protein [unclassified Mesorhizobium]|uniref:hypothetical protein n=1 Tax=unclassified Mesorhizobium TaxID=325217 RepID=UPI001675310A|nr:MULTISPECIES: hypothetical protein [unclassified Mesorhizobium]
MNDKLDQILAALLRIERLLARSDVRAVQEQAFIDGDGPLAARAKVAEKMMRDIVDRIA